VENETGESHYYLSPNQQQAVHDDIATNEQKQNWTKKRGIEVGNIFQLGLYYSNKMHDATFVDQSGQKKPYYMGCYGIGIGRTLATIVEVDHDNNGIVWPENVAPYQYHLCGLDLSDPTVKKQAYELYQKLSNQGKEVLFDDRENISAGAKFADADLIGIPNRLVISKRTGGKIELKKRSQTNSDLVTEI
jgi:prolyl-tRNA synthetase